VETLVGWDGELVVPAFVAAEADYLILSRLGVDAQVAFVDDLAAAYHVEALDAAGLRRAAAICRQYRDLELGLADASVVVLADRWSTHSLATFDQRHFRAVTALDERPFELLP
jgi:predicted nucleic acid-binding protein